MPANLTNTIPCLYQACAQYSVSMVISVGPRLHVSMVTYQARPVPTIQSLDYLQYANVCIYCKQSKTGRQEELLKLVYLYYVHKHV